MKTRKAWIVIIACLLLLLTASVSAQEPPEKAKPDRRGPPPGGERGFGQRGTGQGPGGVHLPPDPAFRFVSSEMRFGGKVVKGAPYSAEAVTESLQMLSDGTRITRTATATVYRDGEGRTRHEQTLSVIGPFATDGDAPRMIFITDPVAGVNYHLDPRRRAATKLTLPAGQPPAMPRPPASSRGATESLGKQVIEGVEAEGTRSVITIPAGQIGNDREIAIISESWYAPELQTVVLSKHSDPRQGEHTYRLTRINRSEPDPALFAPPADYTIQESSFPRGPGMRGPRPADGGAFRGGMRNRGKPPE
jgi:hypothetical protein